MRRVLSVTLDEDGSVDLQADSFTPVETLGIAEYVRLWAAAEIAEDDEEGVEEEPREGGEYA